MKLLSFSLIALVFTVVSSVSAAVSMDVYLVLSAS